jgi:hypothetical protein
MKSWEASADQVEKVAMHAQLRGVYDEALPLCPPDVQDIIRHPRKSPWHPGSVLTSFCECVATVRGIAEVEAIYYDYTKLSFSPLIQTMMQVAMLISGSSPGTVFGRVARELPRVAKNINATWSAVGSNEGYLTFVYPSEVAEVKVAAWKGVLKFLSEFAGHHSRIKSVERPSPSTLKIVMAWDETDLTQHAPR